MIGFILRTNDSKEGNKGAKGGRKEGKEIHFFFFPKVSIFIYKQVHCPKKRTTKKNDFFFLLFTFGQVDIKGGKIKVFFEFLTKKVSVDEIL